MENTFDSDEFKRIFNFHPTISFRLLSRESSILEFKESFNWNSKDRYTKSIISFANNRGGNIIFGVSNSPRFLVGLKNNNFEDLDEAKITEYLNSTFSPELNFEKFTFKIKGKNIGIIRVYASVKKPIICIKNDGVLRESDIYYRYNTRNEKIKYPELISLFDYIREEERKSWMSHFEKISKIGPMNAGILDIYNGRIEGQRGTLVIDEKLIPKIKFIKEGQFKQQGHSTLKLIGKVIGAPVVANINKFNNNNIRVTEDPNAPLVRMDEKDILKQFPLTFKFLVKELKKEYKDFKIDRKFTTLKNNYKKDKNFCFTRFLNPNNPKSSCQTFYSKSMIKEFGKYYQLNNK